jgi:phage-related protein
VDVFNLQASIELELAEFERRLDQAENDMKKFSKSAGGTFGKIGGMLKDGIVAGAKAAVAGITALTVAIGGIAVSAAKSYSTFEQLAGGAQKIFDEIDYARIAKDADNAYKDLNMSANQYLESINLVGATFAQTMGDEKGYETARAGMLAISDYASGTGKSIDELNQKYQMITRATSSYQSIADQFAGILPATSADFLAQAQAAGLLSNEYEKLTQVPVAEYQQALTAMLEKGVSDLGLSQNTLRESTETMTGSIAMATAAWENLKVAMAGGGDISGAMQNFASSASSVVTNIIPTFQAALSGVGTLIKELAPVISEQAPAIIGTLVKDVGGAVAVALPTVVSSIAKALPQIGRDLISVFRTSIPYVSEAIGVVGNSILDLSLEFSPELIKIGSDLLVSLMNGLTEALPTAIPQIYEIILTVVEVLTSPDVLPPLLEAAMAVILALADGFVNSAPILAEKLPIIVEQIMSVLSTEAPKLVETAFLLIGTLVSGMIENGPMIFSAGVDVVVAIIDGIGSYFENMKDKAKELIEKFLDGITEKFPNLSEKAAEIYEKIKSGIFDAINSAWTWGSDLISNFVSGIEDNFGKVSGAVTGVAGIVKDYIGFSEPDKGPLSNFHTFAPDMIDLFTQGVNDNQGKLITSITDMAANVRNSMNFGGEFTPALATGGFTVPQFSGGGIVQNISVTLNIEGSSLENDVNEITDRAVEQISEKLRLLDISDNRALGGAGW